MDRRGSGELGDGRMPGARPNWKYVFCGIGSVGWRQLEALSLDHEEVTVIEPDSARRIDASARWGPRLRLLGTVTELESYGDHDNVIAVVSNWGPDHWRSIKALMELGVDTFYCEKPLTTRLSDLRELELLVQSGQIAVLSGLNRTYMGFTERVRSIEAEHDLGLPCAIVVHGGAQDLATNGIHWVDLAVDLLGHFPSEVVALGGAQNVNPRSSKLAFWEGSASWRFPNGYLSIFYTNGSSIAQEATIYYRDARLRIWEPDEWSLEMRRKEEVARDGRVTRVGYPDAIPVAGISSTIQDAFLVKINMLKSRFDNLREVSLHEIRVHEAHQGLFWSIELGSSVRLPLPKAGPLHAHEWNFS